MTIAEVVGLAIIVVPVTFMVGHMVGYYRGRGRILCPTCKGRGSISVEDKPEVKP